MHCTFASRRFGQDAKKTRAFKIYFLLTSGRLNQPSLLAHWEIVWVLLGLFYYFTVVFRLCCFFAVVVSIFLFCSDFCLLSSLLFCCFAIVLLLLV